VRANFFDIDPKLGCVVKDVGGGVYVVSHNMWQSVFLVTGRGVTAPIYVRWDDNSSERLPGLQSFRRGFSIFRLTEGNQ
jgi:hypothetical protein